MLGRLSLWLALGFAGATPLHAEQYFVRDQDEYADALEKVAAGDVIVLANGEWHDFDLVITGEGRKGEPIKVMPEDAGKVVLTGQSSLRIGGEYIVVSGLVFRDGYSPRGEVISFRRSRDDVAHNSRVTQVVIDHFSKPDRYESDYWVAIHGKNNRFDHNHLVGKTNKGVTLAVRLDVEGSRNNGHRIDHNYFGPRPVLGSNGGETIRIGTSEYSMYRSGTIVERNVFDRCDGEVEIVSSKSGGNVYRENLFLRSRGTLTLRHGDNNLVERNVFLGYGKDYTGGIRVINRNQTVRGNYMEGLRGTGFASALTVMNGVPNSPVNRYVQVQNALIERNTIVDSKRVTLAAGADEERSAPPIDSLLRANLFVSPTDADLFRVEDDISGIELEGNVLLGESEAPPAPQIEARQGELARAANGLLYPVDPALADVGAPRDLRPVTLSEVGVSWYEKPGAERAFGSSGTVHEVSPGEDALVDAVAAAHSGDVLVLAAGEYTVAQVIPLDKTLTIKGAMAGAGQEAIVSFTRPALIELGEDGALQLAHLTIDGSRADDSVGNSVIRTSTAGAGANMVVEMNDVTVRDLTVNKSFNVLTLGKSSLADRVTIRASAFSDITGAVVSAAAETEDFGQYNVEYLTIADSSFADIGGPAAEIYRGGTDESTFGPFVHIAGNTLSNVGKASTNGSDASILLHGVQTARVERNTFTDSAPLRIVHTVGRPKTAVIGNTSARTPEPVFEELVFDGAFRGKLAENTFGGRSGK